MPHADIEACRNHRRHSDDKLYFQGGDGTTWPSLNVASDGTLTDTDWHHLAGTFDGTTGRLYLDGVATGTPDTSGSLVTNNLNLYIGRNTDPDVATTYFNGLIDDVRIYNRALSAQEVKQLYLIGK